MKIRTNQAGFGHVELVLLVLIIGVIGFAGLSVYNRQQTKTVGSNQPIESSSSQSADSVASAPAINSTGDLDKASAVLDQTDPSASNNADTNRLDSQLANF